jgi:4-hydroxy-tetrahydrodipicolinate synthase
MGNLQRLEGVLPVLATPLNAEGWIDEQGLRRLIGHSLAAKVHGLVVLGSTGEFALLSDREKQTVIELTVDEVNGQVPVIAGTGESGTKRAIQMTQMAERAGADAAIVVPPFYFRMTQADVLRHYRAMTRETGLPLLLYNLPHLTKTPLALETVAALAEDPQIVGMKDSCENLQYFQGLLACAKSPGFSAIQGVDALLLASTILGGDGSISPVGTVAPQWMVQLWDYARAKELEKAADLQLKVTRLNTALGSAGYLPAGVKGALSLLGICSKAVAIPYEPLTDAQMDRLAAELEALEVS